ncbi:hypothetical protein IWX47DRAFT_575286 [Phyllosticta citricarpa]
MAISLGAGLMCFFFFFFFFRWCAQRWAPGLGCWRAGPDRSGLASSAPAFGGLRSVLSSPAHSQAGHPGKPATQLGALSLSRSLSLSPLVSPSRSLSLIVLSPSLCPLPPLLLSRLYRSSPRIISNLLPSPASSSDSSSTRPVFRASATLVSHPPLNAPSTTPPPPSPSPCSLHTIQSSPSVCLWRCRRRSSIDAPSIHPRPAARSARAHTHLRVESFQPPRTPCSIAFTPAASPSAPSCGLVVGPL